MADRLDPSISTTNTDRAFGAFGLVADGYPSAAYGSRLASFGSGPHHRSKRETMMDITKLIQPITFEAPPLGEVSIPVRKVGFLSWFDKARADGRWRDGMTFVRSMLGEQAAPSDPEGNGFKAEVRRLTETELEAIAIIALQHALPALAVPGTSLVPAPDDADRAAADRLLEATTAYSDWHREKQAAATRALRDQYDSLTSFFRLPAFDSPGFKAARALSENSAALSKLVNPPELETFRRHQSAIDRVLGVGKATGLANFAFAKQIDEITRQALGPFSRKPSAIDKALGLATSGVLDPSLASRIGELPKSTLGLFVDRPSAIDEVVRRAISPYAALASASAGAAQQARLACATATAGMEEAVRRAGSVYGAFPGLKIAFEASSLFGLNLSKPLASALAGAKPFSALAEPDRFSLLKMSGRGFGTLAAIGIEGIGPAGAISDLLAAYGRLDRSPTFDAVAAASEVFDATDDVAAIAEAIEKAWQRIATQLAATPKTDRVTVQGLIAFASLLVALWSGIVAQLAYNASADAPTKVQMEQVRTEVRSAADNAERRDGDRERHIRYIDRPAPLRVAPDAHAHLLRTVYPDQLLRVRDTRGSWAYVDVYDYASDQPISGWVSRARLRHGS